MTNSNLIKISKEEFNKNLRNLENLSPKEFAHKMFNTQGNEKQIYFNYLIKQPKEFKNEVQDYLNNPKSFLYL